MGKCISLREVSDTGQLEVHDVTVFYSNAKRYQNVVAKKSYEIYWKKKEKKRKSSTTKELWIMSMGIFSVWQVSKCGVFSGPYFPIFGLNTEINGVNLCIQSEYGKIRTRKNSVFGQFCIYTIADMWKTVRVYFGKKLTMSGVASWIRRKISVNGSRFFKDKSMLDSTPENSDACENWSSMNECLAIVLV